MPIQDKLDIAVDGNTAARSTDQLNITLDSHEINYFLFHCQFYLYKFIQLKYRHKLLSEVYVVLHLVYLQVKFQTEDKLFDKSFSLFLCIPLSHTEWRSVKALATQNSQ